MRVNKPQPFDPGTYYKVGDRVAYNDGKNNFILVVRTWSKSSDQVASKYGLGVHKCALCRLKKPACQGVTGHCWSWNREDRKNIYYGFKNKLK